MLTELLDEYHSKEIEDFLKKCSEDVSTRNHFFYHRATYDQLLDFARNQNTPEPIEFFPEPLWTKEEFLKWGLSQKFFDLIGEDYKIRIKEKLDLKFPRMAPDDLVEHWDKVMSKKDLMFDKNIDTLKSYESEIRKILKRVSKWKLNEGRSND